MPGLWRANLRSDGNATDRAALTRWGLKQVCEEDRLTARHLGGPTHPRPTHGVRERRCRPEPITVCDRFTGASVRALRIYCRGIGGLNLRCESSHSVAVDLGLNPETPPPVLYHGTVERFVTSIMETGLEKRARQHVHLSPDIATANRVGSRRGQPVILKIAAAEMHSAGFLFFRSANGVWLTEQVPPQYISRSTG